MASRPGGLNRDTSAHEKGHPEAPLFHIIPTLLSIEPQKPYRAGNTQKTKSKHHKKYHTDQASLDASDEPLMARAADSCRSSIANSSA